MLSPKFGHTTLPLTWIHIFVYLLSIQRELISERESLLGKVGCYKTRSCSTGHPVGYHTTKSCLTGHPVGCHKTKSSLTGHPVGCYKTRSCLTGHPVGCHKKMKLPPSSKKYYILHTLFCTTEKRIKNFKHM